MNTSDVGHAYPTFIEGHRPQPRVDFVFSPFNVDPCPNSTEFRPILYMRPFLLLLGVFYLYLMPVALVMVPQEHRIAVGLRQAT